MYMRADLLSGLGGSKNSNDGDLGPFLFLFMASTPG